MLDIDLDSGKYFVKYCLEDFGLPIDMHGERIINFKTYMKYNIKITNYFSLIVSFI